jgi:hypothetical protein
MIGGFEDAPEAFVRTKLLSVSLHNLRETLRDMNQTLDALTFCVVQSETSCPSLCGRFAAPLA